MLFGGWDFRAGNSYPNAHSNQGDITVAMLQKTQDQINMESTRLHRYRSYYEDMWSKLVVDKKPKQEPK
jgi:hypothetical protein